MLYLCESKQDQQPVVESSSPRNQSRRDHRSESSKQERESGSVLDIEQVDGNGSDHCSQCHGPHDPLLLAAGVVVDASERLNGHSNTRIATRKLTPLASGTASVMSFFMQMKVKLMMM